MTWSSQAVTSPSLFIDMSEQYGHKKRSKSSAIPVVVLVSVFLWSCILFCVVSGQIAGLYDYHPALGKFFNVAGVNVYSPLSILGWPSELWSEPETEKIVQRGLMFFVLPPVFLFIFVVIGRQNYGAIKDLHGSAKWANRKEIEEMGYFEGKGVYVGGWFDDRRKQQFYLRHNGPEHVLCFAPTRSGKGVGLILPTLLSWEHSSVVLDIKGENWALTSGFRKNQGHTVIKFDPSDHTKRSARFNPLEEIRIHSERAISDIQQVATMVLDPEGKGLVDYWEKAAFSFFGGVILHTMIMTLAQQSRTASLYDVSIMLEDPDREAGVKGLFREMIGIDHAALLQEIYPDMEREILDSMHVFCAAAARGMLAKADKEMSGVVSTVTANLGLYRDPVVAYNTRVSDFKIEDLMTRENPVDLYLVISPADIARIRPLLRIFTTQFLGRLTERMEFGGGGTKAGYKHRLLLLMDEFTSLGKLPIIEQAIAYMAGYGVKGYFIVQDTKQLNGVYGQDNALMANCHIRIAYAPNIPETAEYLSKLTGTTTVVQRKKSTSRSKHGYSSSLSIQETARALLTPDECLRLPGIHKGKNGIESGDMLIFTAGHSPIYGRQLLHFVDPVFSERSKVVPPKLSDSLYFTLEPELEVEESAEVASIQEKESARALYERYLYDLPPEIGEGELA